MRLSTFPLSLKMETAAEATVVRFVGTRVALNEQAATVIGEQLGHLAKGLGGGQLLVDFGNVEFLSSITLGTLVKLHRQLQKAGGRLVLCNLAPEIHQVLEVTHLNTLLDIRRDEPAGASPSAGLHPSRAAGVLVVDDEPAVRAVLITGLRQHGFTVWPAATGPEAVELYRRHHQALAVALLDVAMQDWDGPRTLAALQEVNPGVLCCFMKGDPGNYTREALLNRGAEWVFQKPFRVAEVAQVLHRLINQCSPCEE